MDPKDIFANTDLRNAKKEDNTGTSAIEQTDLRKALDNSTSSEKKAKQTSDAYTKIFGLMPVHVTDTSGNRVGTFSAGNDSLKQAWINSKVTGSGTMYYDAENKEFTTSPKAKLTFSEGKVKISAPQEIVDSDWFKEQYSNNDTFKQLVYMYEQDPTGKTEVEVPDTIKTEDGQEQEVTKKITINDMLKSYGEVLEKNAESYGYNISIRNQINKLSGGNLNLTDSDIQFFSAYQDISKGSDKNNKYKGIAIPDTVAGFFGEGDGLNKDTMNISAEDWYKWYNVSLGKTTNGQGRDIAIQGMTNTIQNDMSSIMQRMASISQKNEEEYTEEDKKFLANREYYTTQFAKSYSLLKVIQKDQPDVDLLNGAYFFTNAFCTNALSSVQDTFYKLETAGAYVIGYAGSAIEAAVADPYLRANYAMGLLNGMIEDDETYENTLKRWGQYKNTSWEKNIARLKQDIDNMRAQRQINIEAASEQLADLSAIYSGTSAAILLSNLAVEAVKQIAINAIGGSVAELVGNAAYGAMAATSSASKLSTLTSIIRGVDPAMKAIKGTFSYNVVRHVADAFAQGIVETMINDTDKIEALFDGATEQERTEFLEAFTGNAVWNSAFDLLGVGRKTFKTKTNIGKIAEAAGVKFWARPARLRTKIITKVGEVMTMKSAEKAGSSAAIGNAKEVRNLRKQLIDQYDEIINTKIFRNEEGAVAGAKKIKDLTTERVRLEVEFDARKRGGVKFKIQEMANKGGFSEEYETSFKLTGDIKKIEEGEGIYTGSITFSKDTGQYINDLQTRQMIQNKQAYLESEGLKLPKGDSKALETIDARIKSFEDRRPSELVNLSIQYVENDRIFWNKMMNYLSSEQGGRLINEEQLAGWRSNSMFGTDGDQYIHRFAMNKDVTSENIKDKTLQNLKDMMKPEAGEYKTRTTLEQKSLSDFSANTEYMDPNLMKALYIESVARVQVANDFTEAVMGMSGTSKTRIGEKGKIAKTKGEIATAEGQLDKILSDGLDDILKESKLGTVSLESTGAKRSAGAFYSARKRNATNALERVLGLNQRGLKSYASKMSVEDIDTIGKTFSLPDYGKKFRSQKRFQEFYDGLSTYDKGIVKKLTGSEEPDFKAFNNALDNTDLKNSLTRSYIRSNNDILKSDAYKEIVATAKRESLELEQQLYASELERTIKEAEGAKKATAKNKTKDTKEAANKVAQGQADVNYKAVATDCVDDLVATMEEGLEGNKFFENLVIKYEENGISPEVAREYAVLDYLHRNKKKVQQFSEDYFRNGRKNFGVSLTEDVTSGYAKKFSNSVEEITDARRRNLIGEISKNGDESLLKQEEIYSETLKYMEDITGQISEPNVVEVLNRTTGDFEYYEVPDYTADLIKTVATPMEYNAVVRFLSKFNGLSRVGQIVLSKTSLVTQGFKDTFMSFLGGGQYLFTEKAVVKDLIPLIGESQIEAFKKEFTEGGWNDFLESVGKRAVSEGVTEEYALREVIAEAEASRGETILRSSGNTRKTAFESAGKEAKLAKRENVILNDEQWTKNKKKWHDARDKASEAITTIKDAFDLHEKRESFLRMNVYRNNLDKGLKQGLSLEESRLYANFYMSNATTNFNRAFGWGNSIVKCIPFFGAAINGSQSLYRLLEVDPIGVTGRFIGGLVVPAMGLTYMSLNSEDNKEIYKNIPEYDKENSIAFVLDGQAYSIPVPEELAQWLSPFRHVVEKANDANDLSWMELTLSDILSAPTIDLSGLLMLDDKKLGGDPTVTDRISSLASSLISQLSPTAVRTAYIAVSGKDPYTGRDLSTNIQFMDENGDLQLESYAENEFVGWLSGLMKKFGWDINPGIMEGIVGSLLGKGTTDIIEDIFSIGNYVATQETESLESIFDRAKQRITSPLTATRRTDYDEANVAWWSIVKEMKNEKAKLVNNGGILQQINTNTSTAKTISEKNKYQSQFDTAVEQYQRMVVDKVKSFQANYPSFYDKYKFAATLTLLNYYNYAGRMKSYEAQKEASDLYYENRNAAIETLYKQGFTGADDGSIIGYLKYDSRTGEMGVDYADPLVISFSSNEITYGGSQILSNVKAAVDYSGIAQRYKDEFYKKDQELYKAKKYDERTELRKEWDKKVMNTIIEYVGVDGLGKILNSSEAIDYLDNYIKVPSDYETNNKGKYFSASRLNKERGFAQSYIKTLYNELSKEK